MYWRGKLPSASPRGAAKGKFIRANNHTAEGATKMANIEKLEEQTTAGRELTDEEIEMAAGGFCVNSRGGFLVGLEDIGRGLKEIFTGNTSEGCALIRIGLEIIQGKGG